MICLGMIAVVIAVTIVLALIPMYLHTTTATSNTSKICQMNFVDI